MDGLRHTAGLMTPAPPHDRLGDEGGPDATSASATRTGSSSASSTASAASRSATAAPSSCSRATTCRSTAATRTSSPTSRRTRARASRSTARSSPSRARGPRFQGLGHQDASIFYYVFDILWLDGEDVRDRPLRERKALLKDALNFQNHVRLTAYRNEAGEAMFAEACAKGWEGVIAKRADSVYTRQALQGLAEVQVRAGPGARDRRLHRPARLARGVRRAARRPLRPDGALRYAGKVGTGFDRETLKDLGARMRALVRDDDPVRRLPQLPRRDLDRAGARRPVRLRRVDHRGPPAPPALPRPAHRQARVRRRPRAS